MGDTHFSGPVFSEGGFVGPLVGFGDYADAWAQTRYISSSLPTGAQIGDSITAPDYTNSRQIDPGGGLPWSGNPAANWNKATNGYMEWALALSGQRATVPLPNSVWSFPGYRSDEIYAYLPAFLEQLPATPGFVVVECGTNDIVAGVSYSTMVSRYINFITTIQATGTRVIFVPILPRNSTDFTQAKADVAIRVNGWLFETARNSGGTVAVANCIPDLSLTTSTLFEPNSNMVYDGIHPNSLGAFYIGKAIAAILTQWYPPVLVLPTSAITWNSTNSPTANYLTDCMLTSGITATAPVTGTRPVNYAATMSAQVGLTCASSLVTSAYTGMPMAQLVFGGSYTIAGVSTPTTSVFGRYQAVIGSGAKAAIQVGDVFEALVACEVDARNNAIQAPTLEFRWDTSANQNSDMRHAGAAQGDMPSNEAIQMVLRSPPHTYTSVQSGGEMSINLFAYLKSTTGTYNPDAAIRWGQPIIRKILT